METVTERLKHVRIFSFTAYATRGTSLGITPDYRPEPIMGAFSWTGSDIQVALGIERDVLEVRGLAKDVLVTVVNAVNNNMADSTRVHLIHETGAPSMPTYNAEEDCPPEVCLRLDGRGIVFRADCVDCMRNPVGSFETVDYYTTLNDCPKEDFVQCRRKSQEPTAEITDVLRQSESLELHTMKGYRSVNVYTAGAFLLDLNMGIFVFLDVEEVAKPARDVLIMCMSIGIAMACVTSLGGVAPLLNAYIKSGNWFAPKDTSKPTAIVAIDIQGSTTLWARYSEEMVPTIATYQRVINSLLPRYRAYEFKSSGDACVYAFSSVPNAVEFCTQLQIALSVQKWEKRISKYYCGFLSTDEEKWKGLRVQVGLTCGFVNIKFDEALGRYQYHGPTVNAAVACQTAAMGGQILATGSILDQMGERMPYETRPLGLHELPGLDELKALYELVPEGLEDRVVQGLKPGDLPSERIRTMSGGDDDRGDEHDDDDDDENGHTTAYPRQSAKAAALDTALTAEFTRRVEITFRTLRCLFSTLMGTTRETTVKAFCDRWSVNYVPLPSDADRAGPVNPYEVVEDSDPNSSVNCGVDGALRQIAHKVAKVVVETEVLDAMTGSKSESTSSSGTN
eukprot:PhM_4_TR2072/c0_g1_i2/m.47617